MLCQKEKPYTNVQAVGPVHVLNPPVSIYSFSRTYPAWRYFQWTSRVRQRLPIRHDTGPIGCFLLSLPEPSLLELNTSSMQRLRTATTSGRGLNKLAPWAAIRLMASGSLTGRGMAASGMGPLLLRLPPPAAPRFPPTAPSRTSSAFVVAE